MSHERPFSADQQKLYQIFDDLNIQGKTYFHPRLFTVEQSMEWDKVITGGHCKNLFLKDKGGNFALIVAVQDTQIRLNQLHKKIEMKRLSFGNEERLYEYLKVKPGSVTPYALMNAKVGELKIFLDQKLFDYEVINFHPLENWATFSIKPDDLKRFIEHIGHDYQTIDLEMC